MEQKLIFLIKTGVILILFTPLVLGPFGLSLSNYPKTVFFRTLVEIIFIFYLLLIFFNSKHLPRFSPLVLVYSAFVGILIISSFFGINFYRSFWGDLHRAEGLIFHLHLLVFFLILISIFPKKDDWLLFFKLTVIVSGLSSLAGMLQKAGLASFYGLGLPSRISGTFTNPDFFAPYIVLAIFIGIFLLVKEKKKNGKIFWTAILILDSLVLIFSGTRAAWIGFVAGMIFLFLVWFFSSLTINQKKRKLVLFSVLVFAIFVLLMILNQDRLSLSENFLFQRAFSIFNIDTLFSSNRVPVWEIALDAWKDRPILGWGLESFGFLFDKYFKADFLKYVPENTYFDRPHNKVLEVMVNSGIFGIVSYLSIFLVIFYLLIKLRKSNPIASLVFSAFFISYFIQNLFCFDTIGSYLLSILVIGFIDNIYKSGPEGRGKFLSSDNFKKFLKIVLIFPLICLSLVVFYEINIKTTLACRAFVRGSGLEQKDLKRSFLEYKQGINKNTIFDKDFRWELVGRMIVFLENVKMPKEIEGEIMETLFNLKPLLEKDLEKPDRRYLENRELLARINERIYLFSGYLNALSEMENISKKGLNFNNQKPEFYRLLGTVRIFQNNYSEGEAFFQKSFELSPGGFQEKSELYKNLGLVYFKKGNKQKAAENFKKALDIEFVLQKFNKDISPREAESILGFAEELARLYYQELNDLETCRQIYNKAMEVFPVYKKKLQFDLEMLIE